MNPEVGSIMKYFHSVFPVKIYVKEVPKGFETPSLYFPTPVVFDENDTNMSFVKVYSLSVKLFHSDSIAANEKAELIADEVRGARSVVPVFDDKGNPTSRHIRITRLETRVGDHGVATISVQWESGYHYKEKEWPSLENIEFISEVN